MRFRNTQEIVSTFIAGLHLAYFTLARQAYLVRFVELPALRRMSVKHAESRSNLKRKFEEKISVKNDRITNYPN